MTPASLCFVTTEIFPGTAGGIGRLLQQIVLRLDRAGSPVTLLVDAPDAAVAAFRSYARAELSRTSCIGISELLGDLAPDEDIPLWAFHFPEYHRSYRVALALRRLLRTTPLRGVEFPDFAGLGYVTLKWRRLWGDEFARLPMWVRVHGPHELWQAADDRQDDQVETKQLHAMERYALRHADGWVGPSEDVLVWLRGLYGIERPGWHQSPPFERLGPGGAHPRRLDRARPIRLLFYGKVQHLKGADVFVKAAINLCRQRPERLEFDLVGSESGQSWRFPTFRAELEALVPSDLRDRFRFHGPIEPARLPALVLACAVAVVPSRVETFCLAAHELNWIGIPLVLNDLPAFRPFFHDRENCRLFDGTAAGLARTIGELLDTRDPFAGLRWNDVADEADPDALYRAVASGCRPAEPPAAATGDERPLVSVIVPYYEMHPYVDHALASVERSTYDNWELIVIDDGSCSPEARTKLDELRARFAGDPRRRVLSKPNGGLGSARNHGIAHARGRYVLPLDSDDLVHPEYMALAVRALEANPDLDAVSCYVSYFADGHEPEAICDYVIPYDLIPPLVFIENRAGVASSVFRRTVFDRHRYDELLFSYEDWDLWWQLAAAGRQVETLPRILFRYRRRTGSMVNTIGYSRHARLVSRLAERHREALTARWDEVFRLYVEEVARLTARVREATCNDRWREAAQDEDGHEYSVRLTAHLLLRLLRSRVRAWVEAALGRRVVTIQIDGRHPEAQGEEVWCAGLRVVGEPDWRLDRLIPPGPMWERRNGARPGSREMLVGSGRGASAAFRVGREGFSLGLLHHPWSGRVVLTVDGESRMVDLFGRGASEGFYDHFWTGSRWVARRIG